MRIVFLIILYLGIWSGLMAQNSNRSVDKIMLQIPESLTYSTKDIARYINSQFSTQNEKARAIFIWIARNIRYDMANMNVATSELNLVETNFKTLKTRKGVCTNYAELFNDIAGKVGIKSYVVSGYTKQHGVVDILSHAWCIVLIDEKWFMFDPTWGAGAVLNGRYIKQIDEKYYKATPKEFIESHMPFDPLWQLLPYPITNQEFYEIQSMVDGKKQYFNFKDSLAVYDHQSKIDQLISSNNRIEKNGVKNSLIFDRLQYNRQNLIYYRSKLAEEQLNLAVDLFNNGFAMLNKFVEYYNKQFIPLKSDAEIQQMIDTVETCFKSAHERLNSIKDPDAEIISTIKQINKSIEGATVSFEEMKAFLKKYFNTRKVFRKSLFYKFTHVGVSMNKNQ
ncbi:MAG: hypothetical protein HXX14_00225 [Bacteroidetes bacterium]|nr:hypothetical protein [Bacteroidota bacterium]